MLAFKNLVTEQVTTTAASVVNVKPTKNHNRTGWKWYISIFLIFPTFLVTTIVLSFLNGARRYTYLQLHDASIQESNKFLSYHIKLPCLKISTVYQVTLFVTKHSLDSWMPAKCNHIWLWPSAPVPIMLLL